MPRKLPSLNQVRAFEAAARHESFKAAADELFVTQAAVSHQIKALEQDLGTTLFVRGTRQVRLTEAARDFAERLTEALDGIASATQDMVAHTAKRKLTISVAPFYGNRWLLPRLHRFTDAHPEIDLQVRLSFEFVDLIDQEHDAALRYGLGDWPGLHCTLINRDVIGPVAAPQLIGDREAPMRVEDILSLPLARTANWGEDWESWVAAAGGTLSGDLRWQDFDSRAFAFDCALSGNGVCLADIRMTESDERAGNLVRLHPATIERPQGIFLVCAPHRAEDADILLFQDWLQHEAADVSVDGPLCHGQLSGLGN